jgi:hypothetical protein
VETVQLREHYGALGTHKDFPVLDEGRDWVAVRHGGSKVYVPRHFIGIAPPVRHYEPVEEEYEEGYI